MAAMKITFSSLEEQVVATETTCGQTLQEKALDSS